MAHTRPAWLRAIVNDTDVDPCLPYKSVPVLSQAPSKVQIRAAAAKRSRPALQQQEKNLQCKHCGKVFKRVCNYREHQRVHSNEYKFACSVPGCNRKFMWRSSIQAHMRSHQSKAQRRSRSPISKVPRANPPLPMHLQTHMHMQMHMQYPYAGLVALPPIALVQAS